jgi:hypothetical protein
MNPIGQAEKMAGFKGWNGNEYVYNNGGFKVRTHPTSLEPTLQAKFEPTLRLGPQQ